MAAADVGAPSPGLERALAQLTEFLASTSYDDLPATVRSRAGLVARDTCGAILAGSLEPEMRQLTARLHGRGGEGEATVLAPGFPKTSAPSAALINGAAGTFLELDEYHRPRGHPAIHALPAILALGERLHSSGEHVVEALVLAYEVTARASRACRLRPVVHDHGHLGTLGAAVGCGKLLAFNASQLTEVINVASCLGLASPWGAAVAGATVRNVFAGVSNQLGIVAAEAVVSGFTGLSNGVQETFGSILGEEFDPAPLADGLGMSYEVATSCFKLHACCASTHPPLNALLDLLQSHPLRIEDVVGVRVATHRHAARLNDAEPCNQLAAKFSIPFAVATTIIRGVPDRHAFAPAVVADAGTRALAARVDVVEDPELTRRHPGESAAAVEINLADGRTLTAFASSSSEQAEFPAPEAALIAKFTSLISPIISGEARDEAAAAFDHLSTYADIGELTAGLARCADLSMSTGQQQTAPR